MKRILKWIGIALGALIVLVLIAGITLSLLGSSRLNKTHDIEAEAITIPDDAAALARGESLVTAICTGCHAPDLSGEVLIDQAGFATLYASNISGLDETHSEADLIRAIRHAVDQDGRQLLVMPADAFINLSAEDLGAIIAYLKTVPRTGNDMPDPQLALPGRIMLAAGLLGQIFPAEYIDHDKAFAEMPPIGANVEYGHYLSGFCTACHGPDLAGAQPGSDPSSPFAPNLTQSGELKIWTEEDFLLAMRTGVTPSGHRLDGEFMPWPEFGQLPEDELKGLWLYLSSLP
jgi:mono/diheme cytochrome c family protein